MIRKHSTLVLLVVTLSVILGVNYVPETWLTGWDNLHPEFHVLLNIKRSLFAVWQEYQGLGLLGGMGHASDLPRQVLLWTASLVAPIQLLRYIWTFGMLTTGTIGVYMVLKRSVLPASIGTHRLKLIQIGSLFGALFYLTNLATIQMFHTPFEPFVTHFGLLPWLFYTAGQAIEHSSKHSFLWFALITLLSLPQGYVPTVFIVYLVAFAIWTIFQLLRSRTKNTLKTTMSLWAITVAINAFWLFPFLYFTATRTAVTVNAKISQMATEEIYQRNRAYGTMLDTIQLKGFWFDTFDFDSQRGALSPVLGYWRTHAERPAVIVTESIFFSLMLIGAWIIIRDRKHANAWIIGIFLFCILMLTTDTPPFSWIQDALRNQFPLFHQVFRFPFTKFSFLAAFSYSLLFAVGISEVLVLLYKKRFRLIFPLVIAGGLIIQSYPLFTGHLFYRPVQQSIPQEYMSLFSYLATRPSSQRITNLPQPAYWGWTYERWGYTGSGFLWYGIEQPILDRAFDVWSGENENYYWELSAALYAKDADRLDSVLGKYDVKYILLDENVVSPNNNRSLFVQESKELLARIPTVKQTALFGKLTLYERINTEYTDFIKLTGELPTVNTYTWTDNDVAYRELGDYVAVSGDAHVTYPYRSLFSKRSISEREFSPDEILSLGTPIYDSTASADLRPQAVKPCGLLIHGSVSTTNILGALRFESINQRGCLSFGIPDLSHRDGYLVAIESRHTRGRPLLFSLINETAKHVELETYLPIAGDWKITYLVLPPLAPDGLGYSVYISNDAIGRQETVNDIRRIRIYRIPYDQLVHMKIGEIASPARRDRNNIQVSHPNPAYYKVSGAFQGTLVLSQSYDPGWVAVSGGKMLPHVLANNWANGWIVDPNTNGTIYVLFWPQLLEFFGFALLPIPFLFLLRKNRL